MLPHSRDAALHSTRDEYVSSCAVEIRLADLYKGGHNPPDGVGAVANGARNRWPVDGAISRRRYAGDVLASVYLGDTVRILEPPLPPTQLLNWLNWWADIIRSHRNKRRANETLA